MSPKHLVSKVYAIMYMCIIGHIQSQVSKEKIYTHPDLNITLPWKTTTTSESWRSYVYTLISILTWILTLTLILILTLTSILTPALALTYILTLIPTLHMYSWKPNKKKTTSQDTMKKVFKHYSPNICTILQQQILPFALTCTIILIMWINSHSLCQITKVQLNNTSKIIVVVYLNYQRWVMHLDF